MLFVRYAVVRCVSLAVLRSETVSDRNRSGSGGDGSGAAVPRVDELAYIFSNDNTILSDVAAHLGDGWTKLDSLNFEGRLGDFKAGTSVTLVLLHSMRGRRRVVITSHDNEYGFVLPYAPVGGSASIVESAVNSAYLWGRWGNSYAKVWYDKFGLGEAAKVCHIAPVHIGWFDALGMRG